MSTVVRLRLDHRQRRRGDRELGLPCVVGTGTGTATVRTGDRISVDGKTGTVHILEPAATSARPNER